MTTSHVQQTAAKRDAAHRRVRGVTLGLAAVAVGGGLVRGVGLLRDIPRTATVTAQTPLTLWTVERDNFLAAVGAVPRAREVASEHARDYR